MPLSFCHTGTRKVALEVRKRLAFAGSAGVPPAAAKQVESAKAYKGKLIQQGQRFVFQASALAFAKPSRRDAGAPSKNYGREKKSPFFLT